MTRLNLWQQHLSARNIIAMALYSKISMKYLTHITDLGVHCLRLSENLKSRFGKTILSTDKTFFFIEISS